MFCGVEILQKYLTRYYYYTSTIIYVAKLAREVIYMFELGIQYPISELCNFYFLIYNGISSVPEMVFRNKSKDIFDLQSGAKTVKHSNQ